MKQFEISRLKGLLIIPRYPFQFPCQISKTYGVNEAVQDMTDGN